MTSSCLYPPTQNHFHSLPNQGATGVDSDAHVGQDLGLLKEERWNPGSYDPVFSPPAPGTHQVLMCASVAGTKSGPARMGSDQPWCWNSESRVYRLTQSWGPVRTSLEEVRMACLGPQPACAQGGLFSPKSAFGFSGLYFGSALYLECTVTPSTPQSSSG